MNFGFLSQFQLFVEAHFVTVIEYFFISIGVILIFILYKIYIIYIYNIHNCFSFTEFSFINSGHLILFFLFSFPILGKMLNISISIMTFVNLCRQVIFKNNYLIKYQIIIFNHNIDILTKIEKIIFNHNINILTKIWVVPSEEECEQLVKYEAIHHKQHIHPLSEVYSIQLLSLLHRFACRDL